MKVVVTGGAGFIGANLCRRLSTEPSIHELLAYDNLSTGFKENVDGTDGVELVEADILDRAALDEAFAGCDVIAHLAARPNVAKSLTDPSASHHVNATGTLEVLEAARRAGSPHVVVASSSSVYGSSAILPKREDHASAPLSPYAASKVAAEAYARAYAHSFGLDVLAFRFFNVFGPLQRAGHAYAAAVPAFLSAALDGRPVIVHGDGWQTRDFTFVDSVTSVIASAITRRVTAPGPVNLAFGRRTSLNELIELMELLLGQPIEREHAQPRRGDVRDSQADQTRLRGLFPDIEPIDLRVGLQRTLDWFRATRWCATGPPDAGGTRT